MASLLATHLLATHLLATQLLGVSQVYRSEPQNSWQFFLICVAGFVGFVALVAGAATASRAREARREGRAIPSRRERRRQADS